MSVGELVRVRVKLQPLGTEAAADDDTVLGTAAAAAVQSVPSAAPVCEPRTPATGAANCKLATMHIALTWLG